MQSWSDGASSTDFPESYDAKRLLAFLASVKSGKESWRLLYSHLYYDVLEERYRPLASDILIVEDQRASE